MSGLGRAIQKWFKWDTPYEGYTGHFIFESQLRYEGPTFHTLCGMTIPRNIAFDEISTGTTSGCRKCEKKAKEHNADRS